MFLSLIKHNRWCSDEVIQNLALIDIILTEAEIFEHENELDMLLGKEEMLIDNVTICNDITNIFKKHALNYVTRFGIIVDDEMFLDLPLPIVADFLETLRSLNNIPEDLIINISGILDNRDEYSDLDVFINILNALNPNFSYLWLGRLIRDISNKLIPKIREKINTFTTNNNTDSKDNVDIEEIKKENVELFINILDTIKRELGTEYKIGIIIPQTLLNKDIIKFYKKFGKYEISTLYKTLELEYEPNKPEPILFKYISDLLPLYFLINNDSNLDNMKNEFSFYVESLVGYKNPEWINKTFKKLFSILQTTGYLNYLNTVE